MRQSRNANRAKISCVGYGSHVHNEDVSGTLDLGLYYSPNKRETQVAKVSQADRATHMYVMGATGTGKTRFLEFLVWQDIVNEHGFGVIDPHGDLIEDIRGFLARRYADDKEVADRVVLVDPTNPTLTVTINPLEKIPGVSVAEQAAELVGAFRKIWADSWGARMEDLMRNSLIALGEAELTLLELTPFLTRRSFRQSVLESVENPTTLDYFRRYDTLTDRAQITWVEPVMNKINAFLADERIRQMFSSPKSSFQLRQVMDGKQHLLVKLDKGKLKGAADLLGSLFMAKIQMTAFSRSDLPPRERVPFYLYIDEFQNFATESFETILSEARKYGLSLVMAHQSFSQIPDSLRGLLLSSAGVQVFFRANRSDASLLAKEVFKYSGFEVKSEGQKRPVYWSYAEEWERKIAELQHLPPRTCYIKHKIQGGAIQIRTADVPAPCEMMGMNEASYSAYLSTVPIGARYLRSREELIAQSSERVQALLRTSVDPVPPDAREADSSKTRMTPPARTREIPSSSPKMMPAALGVVQERNPDPPVDREHRRLQHLIKQLAEKSGYVATIEEPTSDGRGRVDVGFRRDGSKIACEVSITTSPEHELANIEKCLGSRYDRVILCCPEQKQMEKVKALCLSRLPDPDQQRVLFLDPAELAVMLEEEAASAAGKEGRVKGYKVKVNYQAVDGSEKKSKREAIAQIMLQSLRHDRDKEE